MYNQNFRAYTHFFMNQDKIIKNLVTTSIEETWFKNKKNIFLGHWCKNFKNIEKIKNIDHEILNHHWQDRDELINKDWKYLKELNSRVVEYISNNINFKHNNNYGKIFWSFASSIWTLNYLCMLYDKWKTVESCLNKDENYLTKIVDYNENDFIPSSTENFYRLKITDIFNHYLYAETLKYFQSKKNYSIKFENIKYEYSKELFQQHFKSTDIFIHKVKYYLRSFTLYIYSFLYKKNKYCILDSYSSKTQDFLLNLSLGQFPILFTFKDIGKKINIKRNNFDLFKKNFDFQNDFEEFVNFMLPKSLPFCFFENLDVYLNEIKKKNLPENPKAIYAPNISTNTLLSIYCGIKKTNGAKIIFAQHGGSFGQSNLSGQEYLERSLSDAWLSWGWSDKSDKKIIPFGIIKNTKNIIPKFKEKKKIVLIQRMQKKYITLLDQFSSSVNTSSYFDNHKNFINKINNDLKENLILRYKAADYIKQRNFDKKHFPNIQEDKSKDIYKVFNNARVVICETLQTTYLETLYLNIPTVIFIGLKSEYNLRDSFLPFLQKLKNANIFFDDPVKAAEHINKYYSKIDDWWLNEKTQEVVKDFCNNYASLNKDKLSKIKKIIKKIDNDNN